MGYERHYIFVPADQLWIEDGESNALESAIDIVREEVASFGDENNWFHVLFAVARDGRTHATDAWKSDGENSAIDTPTFAAIAADIESEIDRIIGAGAEHADTFRRMLAGDRTISSPDMYGAQKWSDECYHANIALLGDVPANGEPRELFERSYIHHGFTRLYESDDEASPDDVIVAISMHE